MSDPKQSEPYTVLITGAASGIGHCFAKHYLTQADTIVIAVDKDPIKWDTDQSQKLFSFQVDFSSTQQIQAFVHQDLRNTLGDNHGTAIDLVIHSAGIRGLVPAIVEQTPNDVAAAETLAVMDAETMLRTYQINTLGTFTLVQSLVNARLLRPSSAKLVVMTSRMGSISYNATAGGAYAYRASKAALNAVVKSFSIDVRDAVFALVHPGRVETGLTRCREEGAMEVDESVGDMLGLIGRLEAKDSGRFMDRFGEDIGW